MVSSCGLGVLGIRRVWGEFHVEAIYPPIETMHLYNMEGYCINNLGVGSSCGSRFSFLEKGDMRWHSPFPRKEKAGGFLLSRWCLSPFSRKENASGFILSQERRMLYFYGIILSRERRMRTGFSLLENGERGGFLLS